MRVEKVPAYLQLSHLLRKKWWPLISSFSADLEVIIFAFSGENGWSDFNKLNYFLCAIMYDKVIG